MAVTKSRIENNLTEIRRNIASACSVAGRSADEVSIVAVTKSVDMETVKNLLDAGLTELGENRVTQLSDRAEKMHSYLQRRRNELTSPVQWHMIGHLQRNKVKRVLETSAVVQSIDSLRLAEAIDMRALQQGVIVDVMLQVNCSREGQKFGCAVGAAVHLAEMIASMEISGSRV